MAFLKSPHDAAPDDGPTRFFAIGGAVRGMAPDGTIIDVYGQSVPDAEAPAIRVKIEGFLRERLVLL